MLYIRAIFLVCILLYSKLGNGQNVRFDFIKQGIFAWAYENPKPHQLIVKTDGDSAYDFSNGILYSFEKNKMVVASALKLITSHLEWYYYFQNFDIKKIKGRSVVPSYKDDYENNVFEIYSGPVEIATKQFTAEGLNLVVDSVWISSFQDSIGEYCISPSGEGNSKVDVFFTESTLASLKINNSILNLGLEKTSIDTVVFTDFELSGVFEIKDSPLPSYIQLKGIVGEVQNTLFDLTQFQITDSTSECALNLGGGVASQIKANYKYFHLAFDSATSMYDKEQIYTELLNMQRANYFLDGYEKLDKEYKAFKYLNRNSFVAKLQNWIDKHWWDYGYDKFMVIQNSFILFLLFFVINLLAYRGLTKVYHPIKFREFEERLEMSNVNVKNYSATKVKNYIIRIPVIFLYTAFVFWGLKLDLKELEIKKPFYMTILIGQYIIGLVCLAYIANYIISK